MIRGVLWNTARNNPDREGPEIMTVISDFEDALDSHINATIRLSASDIASGQLVVPAKVAEHIAGGRLVLQLCDYSDLRRNPGAFEVARSERVLSGITWPKDFRSGQALQLSVGRGGTHRVTAYFDSASYTS